VNTWVLLFSFLCTERGCCEAGEQGAGSRIHGNAAALTEVALGKSAAQHADGGNQGFVGRLRVVRRVADRNSLGTAESGLFVEATWKMAGAGLECAASSEDVATSIRSVIRVFILGSCHPGVTRMPSSSQGSHKRVTFHNPLVTKMRRL
jgi:hypothetical protein